MVLSPMRSMGEYPKGGRGPLAPGERNGASAPWTGSALPRGPLPASPYSPI